MLHGKGKGNYQDTSQAFLTQKYEDKRLKGLEDRLNLTADERLEYEISGSEGGGRSKDSTYQMYQFPFPTEQSIRKRVKVDMRVVNPKVGGD